MPIAIFPPRLPDRPLPPDPPVCLARAPRPWLTRRPGECAFPVDGLVDGQEWRARACCNPCGAHAYCPAHRDRMRGPAAPTFEELMLSLEEFL